MVIACSAILCLVVCMPLYLYYKSSNRTLALCFKVLGSLCAVVPALIAAVRLNPENWLCVVALLLCAIADLLLDFSVILGGTFFASAHITLIWMLYTRYPVSLLHIVCILLLLLMVGYLLFRWHKAVGKQLPMMIAYGALLAIMSGTAIAAGINAYTVSGWLIAAGGGFFMISDCLIGMRAATRFPRWMDYAVIVFYDIALLCFGCSCLL